MGVGGGERKVSPVRQVLTTGLCGVAASLTVLTGEPRRATFLEMALTIAPEALDQTRPPVILFVFFPITGRPAPRPSRTIPPSLSVMGVACVPEVAAVSPWCCERGRAGGFSRPASGCRRGISG